MFFLEEPSHVVAVLGEHAQAADGLARSGEAVILEGGTTTRIRSLIPVAYPALARRPRPVRS